MTLHPWTIEYLQKHHKDPRYYGPEVKRLLLGMVDNIDVEVVNQIAKALSGE
jgi:hypothetical protein